MKRRKNDRLGAAVVEFAVVAPFMFLLLAGIIEFGRMTMVKSYAVNASRDAARKAILPSADEEDIKQDTKTYLQTFAVNEPIITIDPPDLSSVGEGDKVTVSIEIDPEGVTWLPNVMFMGTNKINASTSMRREY